MKFSFLNNQKGFTMLEVIIAISMLSFGIIAVYFAFVSSVKLSGINTERFTAAYLAQEGVEIIRNIRDKNVITRQQNPAVNWSDGLLSCTVGCQADYKTGTAAQAPQNQLLPYDAANYLKINADGLYSYDAGNNSAFRRKITITQPSSDVLKVTVQITYKYSSTDYTYQISDYLYNYWQ